MDVGSLYTDSANRLNICYDVYCNEIYGVLFWVKTGEDKFTYNEIDNLHKITENETTFSLLLSNYVYSELYENMYFTLNELLELISEENNVRLKMLMSENDGLFSKYIDVALKVFEENGNRLKMDEYKNALMYIKESIC